MVRLRLVNENDIDGVYGLASHAPVGLTTLPCCYKSIQDKVEASVRASSNICSFPNGDSFLFVLEEDGEIIGCSAVFTKTGGKFPHWTYEITDFNYYSKSFDKNIQSKYLTLKGVVNGPSELGTLFLNKDKRVGNNGKLLSLGRFAFVAQHVASFEYEMIAELRGMIVNGQSPFWNDIGRRFMNCELEEADKQVMIDKSFIKELMPRYPIYLNMLSKESQEVIGVADSKTVPAKILLEKENFETINEIDIFEAGPILSCKTKNIRTVKDRRISSYEVNRGSKLTGSDWLISTCSGDFKVCVGKISVFNSKVKIEKSVVDALELGKNDKVSFSKLRG